MMAKAARMTSPTNMAAVDGCAVIMRRLLETSIIERFEASGIAARIKNSHGDFLILGDRVGNLLSEPHWNLG